MRNLPTRVKTELKGSIRIDSYDHNGSILSVKIVTCSNEYLLGDNTCGIYLTRYIGKRVTAKGCLIKEPGLTYFDVDEFEEVDSQSPEKVAR